jgi:hypothetical protein
MNRRSFLKLSATGSAALAAVGATASLSGCSETLPENGQWRVLRSQDRIMLAAIAPVMLKGSLPAEPTANKAGVDTVIATIDEALFKLDAHNTKQISDLFTLLTFGLTRGLATGVWSKWENASEAEIENFLNSWRESSIGLLTLGYNGLNKLMCATWFGQKEAWEAVGYPGPPYADILITKKSV